MSGNESIRIALMGLGEAGKTLKHTKPLKSRLAVGQQLMDISLMTHIEHQTVLSGIKNGFNGDGQLHHAQIGRKVAAGLRQVSDYEIPDLGRKNGAMEGGKLHQIPMSLNRW